MSEIFNMAGDGTTIMNFTFVDFHGYQYDFLKMGKLMNGPEVAPKLAKLQNTRPRLRHIKCLLP